MTTSFPLISSTLPSAFFTTTVSFPSAPLRTSVGVDSLCRCIPVWTYCSAMNLRHLKGKRRSTDRVQEKSKDGRVT